MSKRDGEKGVDSESAKKQKMGDDEQTQATATTPFAEATKFRNFKLVVEERTLFVSPYFLAEISPFFDTLCLGSFVEGQKKEAELKEVTCDDVIEMLHVLGANRDPESKEINVTNCIPMLTLADKWNIKVLRKKCITFIEDKFPTVPTTLPATMKYLMGCEKYRVPVTALHKVASRLAAFGRRFLQEQRVALAIEDRELFGAIIAVADDDYGYGVASKLQHTNDILTAKEPCFVPGCEEKVRKCKECEKTVCYKHNDICHKKAAVFETSDNECLDQFFFRTSWPERLF